MNGNIGDHCIDGKIIDCGSCCSDEDDDVGICHGEMLTMVMKLKHVLGMMVRVLMVVVVVVMLMVKRVMAMKVGLMVVRGLLMLILLNVFDGHNISRDGDVGMVMGA